MFDGVSEVLREAIVKRLRSSAALARSKYANARYVEHHGVGTRMLTAKEMEQFRAHVDRVLSREVERPIRLESAQ